MPRYKLSPTCASQKMKEMVSQSGLSSKASKQWITGAGASLRRSGVWFQHGQQRLQVASMQMNCTRIMDMFADSLCEHSLIHINLCGIEHVSHSVCLGRYRIRQRCRASISLDGALFGRDVMGECQNPIPSSMRCGKKAPGGSCGYLLRI